MPRLQGPYDQTLTGVRGCLDMDWAEVPGYALPHILPDCEWPPKLSAILELLGGG
jgi:hypothetical protein